MTLQHCTAAADAAGADAGGDILLEGLVEGAALAAVEGEHGGVLRDAGEGLGDHGLGDALGGGFTGDVGDEGVEIAAALGGEGGGGEEEKKEENSDTCNHDRPFVLVPHDASCATASGKSLQRKVEEQLCIC